MKIYSKLIPVLFFILIAFACKQGNNSPKGSTTSTTISNDLGYTSKMSKSDKKKYYDASNNVVFEVKYKPDAFKLRTAAADLLWKVKLYDNKVKISDNEENLNPYEIKIINSTEAKLVKDDTKLGRLTFDSTSNQQVLTANGATPKNIKGAYTPSTLVNLIPGIADDQKKILINELVLKGF